MQCLRRGTTTIFRENAVRCAVIYLVDLLFQVDYA